MQCAYREGGRRFGGTVKLIHASVRSGSLGEDGEVGSWHEEPSWLLADCIILINFRFLIQYRVAGSTNIPGWVMKSFFRSVFPQKAIVNPG